MTSRVRHSYRLNALLFLVLAPLPAAAQVADLDLRLPWDIDAESTSFDGKTSMIVFTGLRLSQGRIGIEADEGRARNTDGEDSAWQFSGNVLIDIENGRIECDSAQMTFVEYELRSALVTGSPATFELRRPGSEEVTYAEAGRLSYDVNAGIVEFSEQATINEGGNQISSNFLVYNIAEQRIDADSSGSDEDRVRIIYTPTNGGIPKTDDEDGGNGVAPEADDGSP